MAANPLYLPCPGQQVRLVLVGVGWILFLSSLPAPVASLNLFLRWRGMVTGLGLLDWLFVGIPTQILHFLRSGLTGYISLLDLAWWVAALVATGLFLISPWLVRRTLVPAQLLTLRYLALALLVFPATLLLPAHLRYPRPYWGMVLLAASHLCILVAYWCPWPVRVATGGYFPVALKTEGERGQGEPGEAGSAVHDYARAD